jgi:GxxExxY protein
MGTNDTNELVYPELSYVVMGVLFDVHNALGTKYQEKHYQRAIEIRLKELHIPYIREMPIRVQFNGADLGAFFIDFVIDGKIVLEIKRVWNISDDDVKQVLRYLRATGMRLGIIANFRHKSLESRRVLN